MNREKQRIFWGVVLLWGSCWGKADAIRAEEPWGQFETVASAEELKIVRILDEPNRLGPYVQTALHDVTREISRLYQINCDIDRRALESIGLTADSVLIDADQVRGTLRSFLQRTLRTSDLTFAIHDDCLYVTTPDEATALQQVYLYDVTNLVRNTKDVDVDTIINILVDTISPNTWEENGLGEGSISPLQVGERVLLVVRQISDVHKELAQALTNIHRLGSIPQPELAPASMQHARANSLKPPSASTAMANAAKPTHVTKRSSRRYVIPERQMSVQLHESPRGK